METKVLPVVDSVTSTMSTLAERIARRLDAQKGTNATGLATAVGVSKPAVSKWLAGTTKEILAKHVFKAAAYLGCRPEWLADGSGSETREQAYVASEAPPPPYIKPCDVWPFVHIDRAEWQQLDEREKGRAEQMVINVIDENRHRKKAAGVD